MTIDAIGDSVALDEQYSIKRRVFHLERKESSVSAA